jgi:hypothetical protein
MPPACFGGRKGHRHRGEALWGYTSVNGTAGAAFRGRPSYSAASLPSGRIRSVNTFRPRRRRSRTSAVRARISGQP